MPNRSESLRTSSSGLPFDRGLRRAPQPPFLLRVTQQPLQPLLQPALPPLLDRHVGHLRRARPARERPPQERALAAAGRDRRRHAEVPPEARVQLPPDERARHQAGSAGFEAALEGLGEGLDAAGVGAPAAEGALEEALRPKAWELDEVNVLRRRRD